MMFAMKSGPKPLWQGLVLMLAAMSAAVAVAQTPPGDAGLDARVRNALSRPGFSSSNGMPLTGSEDIVLLDKRDFWTFSGSLSPQYSDNANLSPDDRQADESLVGDLGLEFHTVYDERYDLRARLGVLSARYQDLKDLSYGAAMLTLTGSRQFATRVTPVSVGLTLQPVMIFDKEFASRKLTQYRMALATETTVPMARIANRLNRFTERASLSPIFTLERTFANPSAYENTAVSADFALSYVVRSNLQVSASVGGFYRVYDDYFEGIVGAARKDKGFRGGLDAVFVINSMAQLAFTAGYTHNRSTSDVNVYNSLSLAPAVSFRMSF